MLDKLLRIDFVDAGIWWGEDNKSPNYQYIGKTYNKFNNYVKAPNIPPAYNDSTKSINLDSSVVSNILHTLLGLRPLPYKQLRHINKMMSDKSRINTNDVDAADITHELISFIKFWDGMEDKRLLDLARKAYVRVNTCTTKCEGKGKDKHAAIEATEFVSTHKLIVEAKDNKYADANIPIRYLTEMGVKYLKHMPLTWDSLELYMGNKFNKYFKRYKQIMYNRYLKDNPSGEYFTLTTIIEKYNHETDNKELNILMQEFNSEFGETNDAKVSFFKDLITCITDEERITKYLGRTVFKDKSVECLLEKYNLSKDDAVEAVLEYRKDQKFVTVLKNDSSAILNKKQFIADMLAIDDIKSKLLKSFRVNNPDNLIAWTKRSGSIKNPTLYDIKSTRAVTRSVGTQIRLTGSILVPVDDEVLNRFSNGYYAVSMLEGGMAYISGVSGNNEYMRYGHTPVNVRDWVDNTPEVKK